MADPIDGPGLGSSDYTWGSKFGWVQWTNNQDGDPKPEFANATTTEKTLLFTGGPNYRFGFNGGVDNVPYISIESTAVNSTYLPELIGSMLTPGGQGLPIVPDGPRPGPDFAMDADLFDNGIQYVTDLPGPSYYYYGVDDIEGFVDQN
jgi:hypothetical protein